MITYTTGNLLKADAEALVNTVNTVGVMGKGIALMFKEEFPENFQAYSAACKQGDVQVGRMFVTRRNALLGPKWIVNFPTKKHWRQPSKLEWIEQGLEDLKTVISENHITSIALPPLGSGNGGLEWETVRTLIIRALEPLNDVDVIVYEPTRDYQNVAKRSGVQTLTPARVLVAEIIRRYSILGIPCSLLEVQKLAYFLERYILIFGGETPLDLRFKANRYGPYAQRLSHLLDGLDGSYLHCDKRIADAGAFEPIWFNDERRERVSAYLSSPDVKPFLPALDETTRLIDGFESPLGMELLATIDWLVDREGVRPTFGEILDRLRSWPGGDGASERKLRLFDRRLIELAIDHLQASGIWRANNARHAAASG